MIDAEKGEERDSDGLFLPGHSIKSPGRPPRTDAQRMYEKILLKKVEEAAEPIIAAAVAKAQEGKIDAFRELNDRMLGKPPQRHELSGDFTLNVHFHEGTPPDVISETTPGVKV